MSPRAPSSPAQLQRHATGIREGKAREGESEIERGREGGVWKSVFNATVNDINSALNEEVDPASLSVINIQEPLNQPWPPNISKSQKTDW